MHVNDIHFNGCLHIATTEFKADVQFAEKIRTNLKGNRLIISIGGGL
jgi:hypothetical protein